MADNLEFLLQLKADMGNVMSSVTAVTDKLKSVTSAATEASEKMNKMGGGMEGLGLLKLSSIMEIWEKVSDKIGECTEKAENFHQAEAQLMNTMQNNGTYTKENFETAVEGAKKLSQHVKASQADIMGLQSQLRMVGSASDEMINQMSQAALDLATKKGIDLQSAGLMIAKSINDPDSLRRLNQQVLIDPGTIEKIQDLSKAGKTTTAQMLLLKAVEQQVGGAAEAAFNADPLAQFNKTIGGLQRQIGNIVISLEKSFGPILERVGGALVDAFNAVMNALGWVWQKIQDGNPVVIGLAIVVGALTAGIIAYNTWTQLSTWATEAWTVAQNILNAAMWASPITWVIAIIAALIAIIVICVKYVSGWGEAWHHTVNAVKLLWQAFVANIQFMWDTLINGLMIGLDKIKKGWYEFKNAVGLGNKDENNAMIAQIDADTKAREKAILDAGNKVKTLTLQAAQEAVLAGSSLKWNKSADKKEGETETVVAGGKPVKDYGVPPGGDTGTSKTNKSIATGGTKNTTVNMTISNLINGGITIKGDTAEARMNNLKDVIIRTVTQGVAIGAALGSN